MPSPSEMLPVRFYWIVWDEANGGLVALFKYRHGARSFMDRGVFPPGCVPRLTFGAVQGAIHFDEDEDAKF